MKRWYWFGALARWCIADAFMPPVFMVLSAGAMIREANRERYRLCRWHHNQRKRRRKSVPMRSVARTVVRAHESTAGGMEGYSYKEHATPPYMVRKFR
jgi:hypothetical protein